MVQIDVRNIYIEINLVYIRLSCKKNGELGGENETKKKENTSASGTLWEIMF